MSRRTNTCQIDHRPDADPSDRAAELAAPRAPRNLAMDFRPAVAAKRTAADPIISWEEVSRRARAAVALAMRGASYSTEDRQDTAAELVARLYAKYPDGSGVPRSRAAMSWLTGYAAGMRRDLDLSRAVDAATALDAEPTFTPFLPDGTIDRPVPPSPETAKHTVLSFLGAAVRPDRRKVRMAVALYGAARDAEYGNGETVAAELGMTYAAYRQTAKRGLGDLRKYAAVSGYRRAVGAAVSSTLTVEDLYLPDGRAPRRGHGRTDALAKRDGSGRESWRHTGRETQRRTAGRAVTRHEMMRGTVPAATGRATRLYPVLDRTVHERSTRRRAAWVAKWVTVADPTGRTVTRPAVGNVAAWVLSMTPGRATDRTRQRLATAAKMTRRTTAKRARADRKSARLAAGITRDPR